MTLSRRNFIRTLGGGAVLAAAAGGAWAGTRDPFSARAPWRAAGIDDTDIRQFALSYAILAPNPHNRQPWLVSLDGTDSLSLYCEPDRRLPETDPFDRQITIGLGAFLEILSMAAAESGNRAEIMAFPEGEPHPRLDGRPVARVRFREDGGIGKDPLFGYVQRRRTNRQVYDGRPVAAEVLGQAAAAVRTSRMNWTNDPARRKVLSSLAIAALATEMGLSRTAREPVDALRIGKAEIDRQPDGIALAGPLVEGAYDLGLLSPADLLDPKSSLSAQERADEREQIGSSAAFVWLATEGNSRADQIAAGRDYLRFSLAATASGLSMQPLSQALQEYPEMAGHYRDMRRELGIGGGKTLQMFVRLGYGPTIEPAPRWPYESRIRA
ncbi:MAG: Acg family FMN-binding oxidoreductase [Rhizobiaceae bacterium]